MIIMCLDFALMVLRALFMWIGIAYRILFPATLKPIDGKVVLVSILNTRSCSNQFLMIFLIYRSLVLAEALVEKWPLNLQSWAARLFVGT